MNDPRLTAYALGELHGPERDQFEKDLAVSEDIQRDLADTLATINLLAALQPSPGDQFDDAARAALRGECLKNTRIARRRLLVRRVMAGGAVAAAIVLIAGAVWMRPGSRPPEGTLAASASPRGTTDEKPLITSAPAPVAMPQSATESEKVAAMVNDAAKFYRDGRLDLAASQVEQALAVAPEDPLARKMKEQVDQINAQLHVSTSSLSASGGIPPGAQVIRGPGGRIDGYVLYGAPIYPGPSAPAHQFVAGNASVSADSSRALAKADEPRSRGQTYRESPAELAKDQARKEGNASQSAGWNSLYMFRGVNVLQQSQPSSTDESYDAHADNTFLEARSNPLSTFSIDVDTASYSNIRRMLLGDQLPPRAAVRIEEMVNYFTYAYPQPRGDAPFSVNVEVAHSPWNPRLDLVRIGLKGREVPKGDRGPANLVFLIDVSGSMQSKDKLPLLQRSLEAMVKNLVSDDRVSIVVYAGASGIVLPSTPGRDRQRIIKAIATLSAGGGTNGAAGIQLAYEVARENFIKGGNNRVILCTDGDFNVGVTSQDELVSLIERERASGVFLSVLGFGSGNLKDSTMEKLADKGNGHYAYIDSFAEGRKVLIDQMDSTLFTIAKDVKIQVEFNPARVAAYRLIGYENRLLAKEDFNDDRKDAGEIGSGHAVTALYEIVPVGQPIPLHPSVDPLKYQAPSPTPSPVTAAPVSNELLTVKLRYKAPDGDVSRLVEVPVVADSGLAFDHASPDFQFAAAVAAFGMKLRQSPGVEGFKWEDIQSIARRHLGADPGSYRAEFLTLVEKAARLAPPPSHENTRAGQGTGE